HDRKLQRSGRFQKTCCEAAEAAISEPGVWFLLEHLDPVEVSLSNSLFHCRIEQEIGDVIGQRAADQKLHREVVHALRIAGFVSFFRKHPPLREHVPHRPRESLEAVAGGGSLRIDGVVKKEVALIERVVGSGKMDRTASVAVQEFGGIWCRYPRFGDQRCAHWC